MSEDLRDFWRRFQTGVEVAVAGQGSARMLGVRDGFRRYLSSRFTQEVTVVVVPQVVPTDRRWQGLGPSNAATIARARYLAVGLRDELGLAYSFYVATEGGIETIEIGGHTRSFVCNWTVVLSSLGESWGASSSVQLPELLLDDLARAAPRLAVPGTRRGGGIISSLTGGEETRRSAVAQSTFNALSSHFYGSVQSRAVPDRHGRRD